MRAYSKPYVNNGIAALYAHFERANDLHNKAMEAQKNLRREAADKECARLNAEYRESYFAAQEAMQALWAGSFANVDEIEASHITTGKAEEDFKLLSLPVTLTMQELRRLAEKHKDNALFIRAVKEYAVKHDYSADDFKALEHAVMPDFAGARKVISDFQQQIEKYYLPADSLIHYDPYNAEVFSRVEETGCFDKL